MLRKVQKNPLTILLSAILMISMLCELFLPTVFALTSGPTQPEATAFHPAANNQLVDPFTGKFSYNIPLLSVGDYPINLSYNSNVSMDQEASWVGLGWNMNIGQITRTMRGLPDDFNGDVINKKFNMKKNITVGGLIGKDAEIAGLEKLKKMKFSLGHSINVSYNNYTGFSLGNTLSAGLGAGHSAKWGSLSLMGTAAVTTGSEGLNILANSSFSALTHDKDENTIGKFSAGYGVGVNSRTGLQHRTLQASITHKSFEGNTYSYGSDNLYGPISFTPQITLPFTTSAISFSMKIGGKMDLLEPSGKINGHCSIQELNNNTAAHQAYGFCFMENGQQSKGALLDFNREKDAAHIPGNPVLPVTHLTPDIFQIGAQGIEGSFRAWRNNAGYVFDHQVTSGSYSVSTGFELNLGSLAKAGADITEVDVNSESTVWEENNHSQSAYLFKKQQVNNPVHPFYFKKTGDLSRSINTFYRTNSGGNNPVKLKLSGYSTDLEIACKKIYDNKGNDLPVTDELQKSEFPAVSSAAIQCLTAREAKLLSTYHAQKYLTESHIKDDHFGQITIFNEDGKRYVFGLPAYNKYQKEASFSTESNPGVDGLVSYANSDNSTDNKKGLDHFFSSTEIPPFAYAWYLTDVLSADYSDMTGNGPSPDDYGQYVQFHSSKKISDYHWRTPFEMAKAQYDEQMLSLPDDDKAHYVCGEREVWYVDSITSKTQVAIFHTSKRNDAFDAAGENGGIGTNTLLKIDSISLYNIHDYHLLKEQALPELRVHFVYDYSLCKGIPNYKNSTDCTNSAICGGKLTLKQLYFTQGSSGKGKFRGYKFNYSNVNLPYSHVNVDRWGAYKTNIQSFPNNHFPYSIQDKMLRDQYASAWLLNKIELPEGGYYEIEYESDDYAFVQDKKAMRMFKVVGTSNSPFATSPSHSLYDNDCLFIDLEEYSGNASDALTAMSQMTDPVSIENLYFKFKVNVDKDTAVKDFVFGYCEMESAASFGVTQVNGQWMGWIRIKKIPTDEYGSPLINPISRAAMQSCRLNTPRYAFDQVSTQDMETDPVKALKELLQNSLFVSQLIDFAAGPNGSLKLRGIGNKFDPAQSLIRLNNPGKRKLGGGARVKKITTANNWNAMQPGEPSHQKVQEFIYELENGLSSGVASYEPLMGADEIPQRQPLHFNEKFTPPLPKWARTLAPNNSYLKEEPMGEMAFPSAEIGYSSVVIKNTVPAGLNTPGTGFSVMEFYTAKDFPVITKRTTSQEERRKWKSKFTILKKEIKDYLTASQGYLVVLNNMHGKPKRTAVYNASGSLVSEILNEYFSPGEIIKTIHKDGKIQEEMLGTEEDMAVDFREQQTVTETVSSHVNLGASIVYGFPLVIPLLLPVKESEKVRFRSATVTRIVYQYGILKKQTLMDLGAKAETENIVFDPISGTPVLTKSNNQYQDPVWSFTYPAQHIYKGMSASGQNLNTWCSLSTNAAAKITSASYFLTDADELLNLADGAVFYVKENSGQKFLLKKDGSAAANISAQKMRIVRSGHRNLLGYSAGTIACLENPLAAITPGKWEVQFNASSKILQATASTFAEGYRERCFSLPPMESCIKTPMGKAVEKLLNKLLNDPGCPFASNAPLTLHTYNPNSIPTVDSLLLEYFNPGNLSGPTVLLRWKINAVSQNNYQASIWLESQSETLKLCYINFSFSCALPASTLKNLLCGKPFSIQPDADCNAISAIQFSDYLSCGSNVLTMEISSPCFDFFVKNGAEDFQCGTGGEIVINPYHHNLKGTWRPDKQYAWLTDRYPASPADPVNLRSDGYYQTFSPFWQLSSTGWYAAPNAWIMSNEITRVDPDGNPLEEKDALAKYSAALLGYNNTLPVANSINAKYRETANENFEDYYPEFPYKIPQNNTCYHFKFSEDVNFLTMDAAHTGHFSMKLPPDKQIALKRPVGTDKEMPCAGESSCDRCMGIFSPVTGNKYVLSYWHKAEKQALQNVLGTGQMNGQPAAPLMKETLKIIPEIRIGNNPLLLQQVYESEEIEGWIKSEYEFTLPAGTASSVIIGFTNPNKGKSNNDLYIDDIRIHPYNATMKSYVYDPYTHRLMAMLDENNFAEFYQYDEEGNLQEIIRETERGRVYTGYFKKERRVR